MRTMKRYHFNLFLLLIVLLGIVYRSMGYFDGGNSLWLDEAYWFNKMNQASMTEYYFRPVGYIAATKFLVGIVNDEITLRLLSYLGSVLTLPFAYLISKKLFRSKVIISLSLLLFSFNPILISSAKEFKPYALELLLHMALIYITLEYIQRRRKALGYLMVAFWGIALFFAYNLVFLIPSILTILLLTHTKNLTWNKILILFFTGSLLLTAVYFLNHYFLKLTLSTIASSRSYWGNKYDVFFMSSGVFAQSKWLIHKFTGLIGATGKFNPMIYVSLPVIDLKTVLLCGAYLFAVIEFIVKKKGSYFILFVIPIFGVISANIIGLWPFGPFRTNIFIFGYLLIVALYGLDRIFRSSGKRMKIMIGLTLFVFFVALQFPVHLDYHKKGWWAGNSEMRRVIDEIYQYETSLTDRHRQRMIITDFHSEIPLTYYLQHHRSLSKRYGAFFADFDMIHSRAGDIERLENTLIKIAQDPLVSAKPVWLIVSKYQMRKNLFDMQRVKIDVLIKRIFHGNTLLYGVVATSRDTIPDAADL